MIMRKREREHYERELDELRRKVPTSPLKMVMFCPAGHQHIDEHGWDTRPHKTHYCTYNYNYDQSADGVCGLEWKPMLIPTVGVKSL